MYKSTKCDSSGSYYSFVTLIPRMNYSRDYSDPNNFLKYINHIPTLYGTVKHAYNNYNHISVYGAHLVSLGQGIGCSRQKC